MKNKLLGASQRQKLYHNQTAELPQNKQQKQLKGNKTVDAKISLRSMMVA